MKNYIKVAHRANTMFPALENTLEAFKSAVANENVGGVEIDIQQTKDGKFVLMNYEDITPVLSDSHGGNIKDYTYEELLKMTLRANPSVVKAILDAGDAVYGKYLSMMRKYLENLINKTGNITTLEEILCINRAGKSLTIEIKDIGIYSNYDAKEYVRRLMDVCLRYDMQNVMFISRSMLVLEAIKEYNPLFTCLPVIGYNDVEKILNHLDGASIANNHLEKNVPGTDLLAHEFLKDDDNLVTQIWNVNTPAKTKDVDKIMGDFRYDMTGDTPDLIDSYLKDDVKTR